jgi:O-antigen ligase
MAAVAAFSFLSGGYITERSTPVAAALLCAGAVWVWFLRRRSRPSAWFIAAVAAFAAFAAWSGLSVVWSFGPDLTWVAFDLSAFYLAVVALLGFTSARGLQLRTVAYGYLAVATTVGVYAFLGKGLPEVVTHAHAEARLQSPIGYWNVLAVMMVMGIVIAVAVGGDRASPAWLRTAAAAAAVPMAMTFFFTFSRGGWLVLGAALVFFFAFTTTRLAGFVTLLLVGAPAALALWHLRGLETLFSPTMDAALRTVQGHALLRWTVVALVVTAGAQLAAALVQGSVPWPRWIVVAAGGVVLAGAVVVVGGGLGVYAHRQGGMEWVRSRVHVFMTDQQGSGNGADRLYSITSNGRITLWREALRQSRYVRAAGTGAGTFSFTHYRFRNSAGVVRHAHSEWFNVLSELGVVGLALFAVAVALFVVALVGNPFSHRGDPLHPLLVALQAGALAFFVHMSWDWDWGMAAIGTLAFVFVAVVTSYRTTRAADLRRAPGGESEPGGEAGGENELAGESEPESEPGGEAGGESELAGESEPGGEAGAESEPAGGRRRHRIDNWGIRVVASVALVLVAACWLPPYLSQRAAGAALADAAYGRVTAGLAQAREAARLDPLAVDPLILEARLQQQLGQNLVALATLQRAARLQPENYLVWYALGELQQGALGQTKQARASFTRALALNPLDAASSSELQRLPR